MHRWAQAQPQKVRWPGPWPVRFLGLGPGPGPMARDEGPMSCGLVLCAMALPHVIQPCPLSYGPVQVARSLDVVQIWGSKGRRF